MADGADDAGDFEDAADALFVCALSNLRILLHDYLGYWSELVCALAVVDERSQDTAEEGMGVLFRVAAKVVLHKGSDKAGRDRVQRLRDRLRRW